MKDVKFIIGACTKRSIKYYFQYNNRVYFIIEKSDGQEKVLDRITNIRYAYDKWKLIKNDSDDRGKDSPQLPEGTHLSDIIDYGVEAFEFESEEKVKQEEARKEKKKNSKKHSEDKSFRDERRKFDKKSDKKFDKKQDVYSHKKFNRKNPRFDKNASYKRNEKHNRREAQHDDF